MENRGRPARTARLSVERLEDRYLLDAGLLQGVAFIDLKGDHQYDPGIDPPKVGATIQLYSVVNGSSTLQATTTTGADGSYQFTGLAAGTYQLKEIPTAGYANEDVQILSQINPASKVDNSTIQVTLLDPVNITFNGYSTSSEPATFTYFGQTFTDAPAAQLSLTANGQTFNAYCSDIPHTVSPGTTFQVIPGPTPTSDPNALAVNAGRIGYLYNHFGTELLTDPAQSQGLQLAIWELEYDTTPDLSSGNFSVSSAIPGALDDAQNYLDISAGKSEPVSFLNLPPGAPQDGNQGMIATGSLNFANVPVLVTINTQQQPPTATVGSSIADKTTVTGGFHPTGTVTFTLYNNPNGAGTPLFTDTEALSGGMATSAGYTATATGTDYWVATYNGDSNNSPVSSGTADEPVVITAATPSIKVVKTADQASIIAGQTAGFTVTITNDGTVTDTGVTLTDPLPAGIGDINWQIDTSGTGLGAGTNPADFTITGSVGSQSLRLSPSFLSGGDSLAPGQSIAVHITGLTSAADAGGATTFAGASGVFGSAVGYTVLYEGTGGRNLSITNVTVNGSIGVGGTGTVQYSGPGTVGGRLDFSAANNGQFHNNNGANVGPSSVNYSVAGVTAALNTVNNLSSSLAGLGNNLTINGTQTINESAGQLATVNGVTYRIFNVTSYSENDGRVVTIHGDGSGDPVVLNFGANSNVNLGGDVALTGGLSDDQVIWNFTSSNQAVQLNNNASSYPLPDAFHGVILAPNDKISLVNANLDGRVFGGDSQDMQIVSGDHINSPTGPLVNTATVSATGVSPQQSQATITINSPVQPGPLQFNGSSVTLTLTNYGAGAITIQRIFLGWPNMDGSLKDVKAGVTTVSNTAASGTSTLMTNFTGGVTAITIGAGQSLTLTFDFQSAVSTNPADYDFAVNFGNGIFVTL
jgi:uncharacterized repeat protein (TIGR01451 family)/choice-of-anchor A domain-containing protein